MPFCNCAQYVEETLESVRGQTMEVLDLIVVDDASTDASLAAAVEWARRHANRFNRVVVLRNGTSAGMGPTRNAGIDIAETPWVLVLEAGNRLLPECCSVCLSSIRDSGAAFAFPRVRHSGDTSNLAGQGCFDPSCFIAENRADTLALVSKEAWAAIGGYRDPYLGLEEIGFCGRLVENGFSGCPAGDALLVEYDDEADR